MRVGPDFSQGSPIVYRYRFPVKEMSHWHVFPVEIGIYLKDICLTEVPLCISTVLTCEVLFAMASVEKFAIGHTCIWSDKHRNSV